jgi:hypothetical protein
MQDRYTGDIGDFGKFGLLRIPMMSISRSESDGDQCGAKRRRTFSV